MPDTKNPAQGPAEAMDNSKDKAGTVAERIGSLRKKVNEEGGELSHELLEDVSGGGTINDLHTDGMTHTDGLTHTDSP